MQRHSLFKCAQHNCRCSKSTQLYAEYRSEFKIPPKFSPSRFLAVSVQRQSVIWKNVTNGVSATHSQAFLFLALHPSTFPWLKLVSSAPTIFEFWTYVFASKTASATASLASSLSLLTVPKQIVMPKDILHCTLYHSATMTV